MTRPSSDPATLMAMPNLLKLFWTALESWFNDNVPRLGAALAYYTLFAMAPVLVVIIGIAGLVFGADAVRGEIVGQISNLVGIQGAEIIQSLLQSASKPREGIIATILGSVTFLLAITGAFLELQAALNTIWRVKSDLGPGLHLKELVKHRIVSLALVVSIGFLLLVSLAASAAVAGATKWLSRQAPGLDTILTVVNQVVSFALTTSLFMLLFRVLPDVKLRWRDVAVGAAVTAILFTLGQQLIGLYIGKSGTATVFGAAGSVVVLMVWIYYTSQIVLFGAEFTRVYTESTRTAPEPEDFAKPDPNAALKAT